MDNKITADQNDVINKSNCCSFMPLQDPLTVHKIGLIFSVQLFLYLFVKIGHTCI